jgi:dihydroxyacetone kinase
MCACTHLSHCCSLPDYPMPPSQVPGTAPAASHLSTADIEIGMGIHNESGYRRVSPVPTLKELIPELLEMLMSTTDPERSFLPFQGDGNDGVVLMVNNLGGLSELELGGIVAETRRALDKRRVVIHRLLAGTFMVRSAHTSTLRESIHPMKWTRRA